MKPNETLSELLTNLRAFHRSAILVAQLPNGICSASLATIEKHLRERPPGDRWFAKTAHFETMITAEQRRALIDAGATEEHAVQKIGVFKSPRGTTFSVPCAHCTRWLSCDHEGEGKCYCGESFVITFDGEVDWKLPRHRRCMDCGEECGFSEPKDNLNPWRVVNARQSQCNICSHMTVGPWWVRKDAHARELHAKDGGRE